MDVALDSVGNIYISEYAGNRIRMISAANGRIYTVAGNGAAGSTGDGNFATNICLQGPQQIYIDIIGNIWISDSSNNKVRKVNAQGIYFL